jgi:hypothetical protein
MPVAKSYQRFKLDGEPYAVNGRMYVKLETGKQVRWYTDEEYNKMYGAADAPKKPKTEKEALGFENGFITIFKGDTYASLDWFRASVCKYNKIFGWYCPSTEDIPSDIPLGLEPIRLEWDALSAEDGVSLKSESFAREYAQQFMFEPSASEFLGTVGKRLEVTVTIKKAIGMNGYYGFSTMHIMEDECGNVLVWTTSAKQLVEGNTYTLKGTVKSHSVYKNVNQTILTRCTIVEGK